VADTDNAWNIIDTDAALDKETALLGSNLVNNLRQEQYKKQPIFALTDSTHEDLFNPVSTYQPLQAFIQPVNIEQEIDPTIAHTPEVHTTFDNSQQNHENIEKDHQNVESFDTNHQNPINLNNNQKTLLNAINSHHKAIIGNNQKNDLFATPAPLHPHPTRGPELPIPIDPTQPLYGNFFSATQKTPSFQIVHIDTQSTIPPKIFSTPKLTTKRPKITVTHPPTIQKETFSAFSHDPTSSSFNNPHFNNVQRSKKEIAAAQKDNIHKNIQSFKNKLQASQFPVETYKTQRNQGRTVNQGSAEILSTLQQHQQQQQHHQNHHPQQEYRQVSNPVTEIPDALGPGHPKGNGNHGWAPIMEDAPPRKRKISPADYNQQISQINPFDNSDIISNIAITQELDNVQKFQEELDSLYNTFSNYDNTFIVNPTGAPGLAFIQPLS
jgi:hypothetical protein